MADVLSHKNFSAAITPKLKLRAVAWRPRSLSPVTSKRLNVSTPLVATGRSLRLAWSKRVHSAPEDHGVVVRQEPWERCLERLYQTYEIGQVSKLPGGNLRVKVKSKEACILLERTQVNILGGVFRFKEFDVLSAKYFIDISNVDSDTNTDLILQRLFLLGCKPVYDTFREVNLATGLTSATWRVYFLSNSCPGALMINGSVCDQVLFDNKLHPRMARTRRTSPRDCRLATVRITVSTSARLRQQQRPTMYAHAAGTTTMPKQTSLQKAVKEVKNREAQLQRGAQHGQHLAANQLAKLPAKSDDALSISTFNGSNSKITPPSSPKAPKKPILLTNGPADGFKTVSNKKKRTRNEVDFSNLMVKQQSQPLDGVATANYFQALQSMEVTFESKNRPDAVKTSTESAFFVEKHHTKIKKASKASPVMEVTEAMLDDENTALLNVIPDRLAEADKKVDGVCKLLENATNPDHISKKAVECPLAFNSALALKMAGSGNEIAELAQLHAINRVFCARNLVTIQHSARSGRNSWARRSRRSAARSSDMCEVVDIVPFD
ncbi:hypothetical protein GQ600_12224 [Phytophthora cactorum]|nr:hypothetical protein GQ600_12224 [Phytophthora cactorum]